MFIENIDAFKAWLGTMLEPICEAEPDTLTKYVCALIKKEDTMESLRQSMIQQLDVFLQSETRSFVDLLLKTLETRNYYVIPNANPPNPNPPLNIKRKESLEIAVVKDIKPIIPVSTLPNLTESINGNVQKAKVEETSSLVVASSTGSSKRDRLKSDSEKEERRRRRSKSRSWDRNVKRSRSPKSPRKSRSWRNKSPPTRSRHRRSRSASGGKSRTPPRHSHRSLNSRYRNRSPPARSLTRSRSREKKSSGAGTPTQDSNHGDSDLRLNSTTQSIQSVVSAAVALNPSASRPPTTIDNFKRRCRDFDEKGYCMRGEMCPYDHGNDPVVLEDSTLSQVLTFGPGNPPLDSSNPNNVSVPQSGLSLPPVPPSLAHQQPNEYNPSAPGMWQQQRPPARSRGPASQMGSRSTYSGPLPNIQRELISVPVTDNVPPISTGGYKRRAPSDFSSDHPSGHKRKQNTGFDYKRLGPRSTSVKNALNCSLELKKIPRSLNNITQLNNHFSRFGKIVNIQVQFENDPEAALVTFSSHSEANAAYRSTEAILNNRFIKVFWHTPSASATENTPPTTATAAVHPNSRPHIKERLGYPYSTNKVLNLTQPRASQPAEIAEFNESDVSVQDDLKQPIEEASLPDSQTQSNNVVSQSSQKDSKALACATIVKNQQLLAIKEQLKKKEQEKCKQTLFDLRKRKQDLLEKQLAQQKLLIEKLEKTNPTEAQRDLLMNTIKAVQDSIESIRKDMLNTPTVRPQKGKLRKTKEEAQRALLDAELELISREHEGGDTSDIQRRLIELKAQIKAPTRGGIIRRGGRINRHLRVANPLKLSKNSIHNVVDHRPTRILVSGYETDETENVLLHFTQYGAVVDYVTDSSTPSIVLNYRTRKEAETAMQKGRFFADRTLSVTWSTAVSPMGAAPSSIVTLNSGVAPAPSSLQTSAEKTENEEIDTQSENADDSKLNESELKLLFSQSESENILSNEDQLLEGDDEIVATTEISEEVLLQDDEEDEEGEEDRSWRR